MGVSIEAFIIWCNNMLATCFVVVWAIKFVIVGFGGGVVLLVSSRRARRETTADGLCCIVNHAAGGCG